MLPNRFDVADFMLKLMFECYRDMSPYELIDKMIKVEMRLGTEFRKWLCNYVSIADLDNLRIDLRNIEEMCDMWEAYRATVEKPRPKYVFMYDEPYFYVTRKEFWDKHHYFDVVFDEEMELPRGFDNCMEAAFQYVGSVEKARAILKAEGFEEVECEE